MSAGDWCTIESDPGVFTELMSEIGVTGLQMEELMVLDEETLDSMKPIYGLIFLFKYQTTTAQDVKPKYSQDPDIFFAQQIIHNACATQAILNVLMNCDDDVDIGQELRDFKSFTISLPNDMRGLAISNSEKIRKIHNSFARQEVISSEVKRKATEDDDVFHFVAYIHKKGHIYELDGLHPNPIDHGQCDSFINSVIEIIQRRIEKYSQTELRFNLMAIVKDKRLILEEQKQELYARLLSFPEFQENDQSAEAVEANKIKQSLQQEISNCDIGIQAEDERRANYKIENIRRKHNYIPFTVICATLLETVLRWQRKRCKNMVYAGSVTLFALAYFLL